MGKERRNMKLVVLNKEEVNIEPGASLTRMSTVIENYADLENLEKKLTKENLRVANFVEEDVTVSTFTDMCTTDPLFTISKKDGKILATFGIRKLTEAELQENDVNTAISYLSDEQAVAVKDLYPEYDPNGKSYKTGDRDNKNGILYKCLQDHISQAGWEPGNAPSLWVALNSGEHEGTKEDPIPVPDTVTTAGFEYKYGKYYSENDTTYLCKRGGVDNPEEMYGQKEILYYGPSALVGQYFEVAE